MTDDPRAPIVRAYLGDDGEIFDNFAGGGGASEAFSRVFGRGPHHAIEHDPEALAMHAANHPETTHHCGNIWDYKPRELVGEARVAAAWFSPDCKDHSSAKGGKPIDKKIRALAWTAVRWAHDVKPGIIFLENVPEFEDWGPCIEIDGETRRDPKRKGQTFRRFVSRLRSFYKHVEWHVLRCCDYGSPTRRKRLFLMASDRELRWPMPTHGPMLAKPHRSAAECIDFSNLGASIFMTREEARAYKRSTGIQVKRPLSPNTLARIAAGTKRFVLDNAQPFIIPVNHGGVGRDDRRVHDIRDPMPTITGGQRGGHALVAPLLIQSGQGERRGQRPRWLDIEQPLGTVAAFLVRYNGTSKAQHLSDPLSTIDTTDRFGIVSVLIDGWRYAIADILMRMLEPRELFRAQGVSDEYIIDPLFEGSPLTRTAQIRMCGNMVPPDPAEALILANAPRAA